MFDDGIVRKGKQGDISYSIEAKPNSDRVTLCFIETLPHDHTTNGVQLDLTCDQANQFAKMLLEMAKTSKKPEQSFHGKD